MTIGAPAPPVAGHVGAHRRLRRWAAPSRRSSLLRVDDWRVRTKLLAVLAVPMLGFVSVAGIQVQQGVAAANEMSDFSRQVGLGRQLTALVDVLQRERDHTAGLMSAGRSGDMRDAATPLNVDWLAVDGAVREFRRAAKPVLGSRGAYLAASRNLDELSRIRGGVLGGWLRQSAVFDAYTKIISDLLGLLPAPTTATDAALARGVRVTRDIAQIKEFTAQVRGRLYAVSTAGSFNTGDAAALADTRAQRRAVIDQLRVDALATQVDRYDSAAGGAAARSAARLEQAASTGGLRVTLDPEQWWAASTAALVSVRSVEVGLLDDTITLAAGQARTNWRTTLAGVAIAALLLLIALLMAVLVSRSMVDTLRRLRDHALDVAQRSLPELIERLRRAPRGEASPGALVAEVEPVEIRSRDEVGELADAFTAVHRNAVRLAGEQAVTRRNLDVSLVNLARRSQTLVDRQLRALDALEANETDPDVLEQLFRVDHLANRMRRNDENLLVLAGADTSRRRNRPLPLGAIVLAATAEVEHYPRVRSAVNDDIYLVGHATGDVIHLIAELLENATVFSPPATEVTVRGEPLPEGGAELVIRDEGIGMTDAAIDDANRQIASPASPDAAASERMGLVVVAHLAAKHHIDVRLRAADPGVVVHVRLPEALVAEVPDDPDIALPAPWLAGAPRPAAPAPAAQLAIEAAPGPVVVSAVVLDPDEPMPTHAAPAYPVARGAASVPAALRATPEPVGEAEEAEAAPDTRMATDALVSPRGGGTWWTRDTGGGTTDGRDTGGGAVARDTGGGAVARTSSAGLPVRVPLAQLPGADAAPVPSAAGPTARTEEPDPEAVGAVLSSFYRGIRRADDELSDEPDTPDPPIDHTDTNEFPAAIDRQGAPR